MDLPKLASELLPRHSCRGVQAVGGRVDLPAFLLCFIVAAGATAQQSRQGTQSRAEADAPGNFVDVTASSGIHFEYLASHTSKKYLLETMGAGVALFDYDNDGRLDIFVVNGAPLSDPTPKGTIPQKDGPRYWNRLYHQKPDGTFEDVTEKAGLGGVGYGMGVAVGDYDNDGYEDLYVTGYGGNHLYHNNGNGTFTDVTAEAGVGGGGWCACVSERRCRRTDFADLRLEVTSDS